MRILFWISFYIVLLGFPCIHVRYTDDLIINLHGWGHFFVDKEEDY